MYYLNSTAYSTQDGKKMQMFFDNIVDSVYKQEHNKHRFHQYPSIKGAGNTNIVKGGCHDWHSYITKRSPRA